MGSALLSHPQENFPWRLRGGKAMFLWMFEIAVVRFRENFPWCSRGAILMFGGFLRLC